MIHNLPDRLKVEANVQTIKNAITKYGVLLCKLPAKVQADLIQKAYLEGEVAEIYYVCHVERVAEVIAGQAAASVANKQCMTDLAKFVADAINTAYDADCVPEMNAIDCRLEMQKIRVVYLPSPSVLAIISLTGSDLNQEQKPVPQETVVTPTDGKKEVTIKITV